MNAVIESLLQDPSLTRRIAGLGSAADAAAALIDAAAARGLRLGHDAVGAWLCSESAQPRELSSAELLAVSGGTRGANRTTAWKPATIDDEFGAQPF